VVEKSITFFIFCICSVIFIGMAAKKNKENLPPVYVLPSENKELQFFSKKFKVEMMEQIVRAIEFAVEHHLPFVEVFQFKNSDFVITLSKKDYLNNLNNIYNYFIEKEVYEYCPRVVRLQETIKSNASFNINDENKTFGNNK